ncbi:Aldolase-type TIM barrel family protein [Prunus dulcis]|uniref:(S)-2-hydroxy-acid oxidase n=1 Tax=Prunus dulcis TaxID=3755 RepID=A0A4Y1R396_PRUDU|nr:Aldolase-type TIM barrel family protein [Prunus dulcis]
MYYDFYTGGAEDQHTLKQNVDAFRRIMLRPRVLVEFSRIDMSTTVLGYKISAPIMIAPTARHQLAHPEGFIQHVYVRCRGRCFQLQCCSVYKRRDISAQIVQRAEKSGYKAIVLTVDAPRLGRREADIKNRFMSSHFACPENFAEASKDKAWQKAMEIEMEMIEKNETWELVDRPSDKPVIGVKWVYKTKLNLDGSIQKHKVRLVVKGYAQKPGIDFNETFAPSSFCQSFSSRHRVVEISITNLPILIKGVRIHEGARKAVEVGVAGIVVSNHGGRQLDYTPTTISVLEEVVDAVGGKVPVLLDGGVRRGTDVFKALALGAPAVLANIAAVGRPVIYGLAANGEGLSKC